MINHLFELKSLHWDENIRELSADTFFLLVEYDYAYIRSTVNLIKFLNYNIFLLDSF